MSVPGNSSDKIRVLFVCMGNICRSPAGEAVMQKLVHDRQLEDRFEIESAGTHAYHVGDLADRRMRHAGEQRGYSFDSRARKLTEDDLATFNLVVAMDRDNLGRIQSLSSNPVAEVKLLSDYLVRDHQNKKWGIDVPDPYYGGGKGFEIVMDMLETACPEIISSLIHG